MTVGVALLLIAVGAILRFAVTDSISGIDLSTVGVILMVVGVLGLLLSVFYETLYRGGRGGRAAAPPVDPYARDRYPADRDPRY
jgi:hypothetical protein